MTNPIRLPAPGSSIKAGSIYISTDKIFHHPEIINRWKQGTLVPPVTVEIHLTERCNNSCYYCQYPKSLSSMTLKDFDIILGKLSRAGTKAIILSGGGEPTLHPGCARAIRMIAKHQMDSGLITNLLQGNDQLFKSILRHCTWCRISLDASTPDVYRQIRGTAGFSEVIKNIRRLVEIKTQLGSTTTIGLQSVINKHNLQDVLDEINLASRLGVDYIQIRPVETMPGERMKYSKAQYIRIMDQLERSSPLEHPCFKIIRSNKWDIINPFLKKRLHGFSFCHAYMMIAAIDVHGDYYVCCHQIETRNKQLCFGNAINEPIATIMSRRQKIIKNLDMKKCYLECRASNINRCLESLKKPVPHENFL
ncbi:MAG: radical SAM protein [Deltaproteobacteria bacterium]|nr:radical SAM protein [Deltaproteobacteria bacterium]